MRYQLKPLTKENWQKIANLQVAPDQRHLIEDNRDSLLEAVYATDLNWTPIGLYVDNHPVGFSMIGAQDVQNQSIWLDRFMIDQTHQGKGYGHALFKTVLNYLLQDYPVQRIYLSVHEENTKAFPFYESFGFVDLEKIDPENGEKIMVYERSNE